MRGGGRSVKSTAIPIPRPEDDEEGSGEVGKSHKPDLIKVMYSFVFLFVR